jgi:Glycoside hydrolase family 5 C-terminal domain/Cellulase (glycosyl hydrolase family 5)
MSDESCLSQVESSKVTEVFVNTTNLRGTSKARDKAHPSIAYGRRPAKMLTTVAAFILMFGTAGAQSPGGIHTDGAAFKDDQGRTLILRGVNLSGTSKTPAKTSSDPRTVSFVGRPFPLTQADEHFRRLQSWGLTFERLIVPWEAIEHAGPGVYDKAYLDYLHELVKRANSYGIRVVIDIHQDFYSRASGGDGAPYWTLTKLGLLPDSTNEPGAPQEQPARPLGYWPPTAARLSVDTMETLFWAGNDFAPELKVDGMPVQEWLQSHYVNAMRQVALRLRDLNNVAGYDTYNEPGTGFAGVNDLHSPEIMMMVMGHYLAPGSPAPSYWDLMQAASGFTPGNQSVEANRLWAPGTEDIWRRLGVWDVVEGKPTLLKPGYFAAVGEKKHGQNYYVGALHRRIAAAIHEISPSALIAQEPSAFDGNQKELALGVPGAVSEPHFYDGVALLSKHKEPDTTYMVFSTKPITGHGAVVDAYVKQIDDAKAKGQGIGQVPTWFGEVGIPYDVNNKQAYRTGDFSVVENYAHLFYEALDKTLSSYSIWCYSAGNSNEKGDNWNGEDFSIYSPDQRKNPTDINSGGRALDEVVRPYPVATAGTPVSMEFDSKSKTFHYKYKADKAISADTEVFLPSYQYPNGAVVTVDGGTYKLDLAHSRVYVSASSDEVTVVVTSQ